MRRSIVSLLLWLSVTGIFIIHLILTQRKEQAIQLANSISERKFREVQTTILERTESEKVKPVEENKRLEQEARSEINELRKRIADYVRRIEKFKIDNADLKKKEKQLKNLARRLAAKLKGKESGLLPKLDPDIPWVFAVTPTYARFTQKADLTRLAQTLMHVTNLHWIIVEDSSFRTDLVSRLLQESGLSFTHLYFRTPPQLQRKKGESRRKHHRGVGQRNTALKWLRDNVDYKKTPGAVYFMDDDNTYHMKIFDEMRWTQRVSVWPVGLSGGARWAGPVVENGTVARFHTNWAADRVFPLDMAGFAINLKVLLKDKPKVQFNMTARRGYLEPDFLQSLGATRNELEPLAENCTKVYVWHTRTEYAKTSIEGEKKLMKEGRPSDLSIET